MCVCVCVHVCVVWCVCACVCGVCVCVCACVCVCVPEAEGHVVLMCFAALGSVQRHTGLSERQMIQMSVHKITVTDKRLTDRRRDRYKGIIH